MGFEYPTSQKRGQGGGAESDVCASGLAAIFLAGIAGSMISSVKPILVAAYVSSLHFGEAQAGTLVGIDLAALSIGNLLVSMILYRWNPTQVVRAAVVGIALGNLLSMVSGSFFEMIGARVVVGLSSGVATGMLAASLTNLQRPERRFGLYLISATVSAAAVAWLSGYLLEFGGIGAMFVMLSMLSVPPLAMAGSFPRLRLVKGKGPKRSLSGPVIMGGAATLIGTLIYFVSAGGAWAFVGQIGVRRDLTPGAIGAVLGGALCAAALGALVSSAIRDRRGLALPIGILVAGTAGSLAILRTTHGLGGYVMGACCFMFCWVGLFPFVMGLCKRFNQEGRLGALCYGVSAAAQATGPAFAGFAIERVGMGRLLDFAISLLPFACAALLFACRLAPPVSVSSAPVLGRILAVSGE